MAMIVPSLTVRWVAVEAGRASVALRATMASAPPDGPQEVAIEPIAEATERQPRPPEPPLDSKLADVQMAALQRRLERPLMPTPRPELADLASVDLPTAAEPQPPKLRPADDPPELDEVVVPDLARRDVGGRHVADLPAGAELSYPSPGSVASHGARNDLPAIVHNPAPHYPAGALVARQSGRTLLRVTLAADGSVSEVKVHRSSGVASLDEAALAAVRRWRFEPALSSGAARELIVPVRFVIED